MYMGVVSGERIFWNAIDDMTKPSSSAKMLDTSALTSTTVELTMLAHQQVPTPLLTTMGIADMRLPYVVHVPSDVAEDATTDATTDVKVVHTCPETVIASVVEDVDMPEENISLKQVTSSKTFDCISFMEFFSHCKADFVLVLSSYILFCVTMYVVNMTFVWTSALTKCNVSQIVWTQPKPQSYDVVCYGRRLCINLRSYQADLNVLGETHKQIHNGLTQCTKTGWIV